MEEGEKEEEEEDVEDGMIAACTFSHVYVSPPKEGIWKPRPPTLRPRSFVLYAKAGDEMRRSG